jgi:hypothetical protein
VRSSRAQGLHSVPDILKQAHTLDTTIRECVCEWIKSAEFRAIDDLFTHVAFFRADEHKITWETITISFQLQQSTFQGWLHRRETEMEDHDSPDLASTDLGGGNSFLTKGGDNCILQWIWDSQCENMCPTPPKYANSLTIFENGESMTEDRADDPDVIVSQRGIPN